MTDSQRQLLILFYNSKPREKRENPLLSGALCSLDGQARRGRTVSIT